MRKKTNEIEKVNQTHGFSINSIISDVMKTFKFRSICHKVGFKKQRGYAVTDIMTLLLVFPLMLLNSVNAFYRSEFQKVSRMKKDAFYRLKNNNRMPWRKLQLRVVNPFQRLVHPNRTMAEKSAFIVDDTVDARVGRKMEGITSIHDHVTGRKTKKLGFKNLTLGLFDGKSFMPVDFSLHAEKPLKKKTGTSNIKRNGMPALTRQNEKRNFTRIKSQVLSV